MFTEYLLCVKYHSRLRRYSSPPSRSSDFGGGNRHQTRKQVNKLHYFTLCPTLIIISIYSLNPLTLEQC